MIEPGFAVNESRRLAALEALKILDTPPEERFDRITRLAAQLFDVPIAVISIIDSDRLWAKSSFGMTVPDTARAVTFCGHTILQEGIFHVPDALQDERFVDNPLVAGQTSIRFYAGAPLMAANGEALGTLCLLDDKPRYFNKADQALLRKLANWAQDTLNQPRADSATEWNKNRRRLQGVLLTILVVATLEFLPGNLIQSIAPEALLMLAVALTSLQGGRGAGLISSAIALAYLAHYYALPGELFRYTDSDIWRVINWGVAMPTIALITSHLRVRTAQQYETKIGDAVLAAHLSDIATSNSALRESHEQLRLVTETVPIYVALFDKDNKCRYANSSYPALFDLKPEEVLGKGIEEILRSQNIPMSTYERLRSRVFEGERIEIEREHRHADGRISHLTSKLVPYIDSDGAVAGFYTFLNDVTALKSATIESSRARERLALALEGSNMCTWDWSLTEDRIHFDGLWSRMLGGELRETVSSAAELLNLIHPDDKAAYIAKWQAVLKGDDEFFIAEHRIKAQNGEWIWISSLGKVANRTPDEKAYRIAGTSSDITARKLAEEQIERLATTDPLTQLPNRRVLADRLEQVILNADRSGQSIFAFLFIDLDRFKSVNDSLGHEIGDEVLRQTALRLSESIRKGDTVARLGGDEFAVVLANLQKPVDAGAVAQKIIDALTEPFSVGEHTVNISCSVGISIFPSDAQDSNTLLRNADLAMYAAKESGRHSYRYFSTAMNAQLLERINLERELRRALANQEFELYYQPKVSFLCGEMAGVEALLRWKSPKHGMVSPVRFIPIAEETHLILPIGDWILRTACSQMAAWQKLWGVETSLAVNISVVQIDRNLCKSISAALQHSGLEARFLEIEITENVLLRNVNETIEILSEVSALGVQIAIDDFGTGYSSLSYLRDFKVDTVKIDQSFVKNMLTKENDATIVRAIIALAHSMKLGVVAEGVETVEQRDELRKMGCDLWQGYLHSRPWPASELEQRLFAAKAEQ